MALIASPLRGLLKNVALRSPYICPRCQLQAIKASRDSLQFQRRALRTRPHKQRQPVQPQQGYQDIETIARNRKGLVEDEDSYELEEGDEDGEMEHSGYRPGSEWRGLKTMKPSEWDAQAQYAGFGSLQIALGLRADFVLIDLMRRPDGEISNMSNGLSNALSLRSLPSNKTATRLSWCTGVRRLCLILKSSPRRT